MLNRTVCLVVVSALAAGLCLAGGLGPAIDPAQRGPLPIAPRVRGG